MPLVDDIWTTTDTETGPTATLLNRISSSVRTALTALKARVTALEARPKVYRAAASSDATGLCTFAVPAGTFAAAPIVTASCNTTTQNTICMIETVTTTSITVRVRYWAGAWATSNGFTVSVVAAGV